MVASGWQSESVPEDTGWSLADAWFITAAYVADKSGGCDLSAIVEAGDYLNHSIFNRDEVEHAQGRLSAAGLLEATDGHYRITPAGRGVYSGDIRRALDVLVRDFPDVHAEAVQLDAHEYREAVNAYRRRFDEAYQRLRARNADPGPERD